MTVPILLGAVMASANLVTYTNIRGGGSHNDVMVMEESGADVRELYSPTLYASGNAITPQGSDGGAWIAFQDENWDLYKIPADGLGPAIKLLCNQGQYIGEDSQLHPYFLSGFPTWSPDGGNLLLLLIDWDTQAYFHALLDANALATEDCVSDLQHIPYVPPDPLYDNDSGGWELIPSATWNDDGSKIAFLEAEYDANDWVIDVQLAILENGEAGWTTGRVPMAPVDPNVEVPWNLYRSNLDWQRGGNILAFSQRTTSRTTPWLYWVDATTGDWGPMTINGVAAEGHAPTWSPEGTTLMYSNAQFKLVTRPYLGSGALGGPETIVGSGGFADWQRGSSDPDCFSDGDCGTGFVCCSGACIEPKCISDALCEEIPPDVCTDDLCDPCTGCSHEFDSSNDPSCVTPGIDCSQFTAKKPCNAEISCRWDNRNGICIDN